MSEAVFPSLIGQEWPVNKTPAFHNIIQKSVSGKRKALALMSYPLWTFKVSYSFLSDNGTPNDDIHTLMGFFLARQGNFDDFLFDDKSDNLATDQTFGVGDGATTQFQLVRNYGGFIEPVLGLKGTPTIKVNGITVVPSTVSTKGKVTFSSPPAAGAMLTWSGGFYYRVAFVQEETEFENFMQGLWANRSLELITVK